MGEKGRLGAARWADLGPRLASALVLAPVALLCVWVGGAPYALLIAAGGAVLAVEWAGLCGWSWPEAQVAAAVAMVLVSITASLAAGVGPALAVLLLASLWTGLRTSRLLPTVGPLYIGLPVLALLWLRLLGSGRADVVFLLLVVWASDVGAYLLGRLLRGPKLAPRISPGKTWAGAVGGLLGAALVGVAMSQNVGVALLLGVMCQAGDLLESGIKRHVGVKDSGHLIPGHGGLLDRVDGLLASAVALALVRLANGGGGI